MRLINKMIKHEKPPNYEDIERAFTLKKGVVFSYYPYIYDPDKVITPDLMVHELVHIAQQKEYGVEKWWERYIGDGSFRVSQEIPAYQSQYKHFTWKVKDRNRLARILQELANELSGELYGNVISLQEALIAIKKKELYNFKVIHN